MTTIIWTLAHQLGYDEGQEIIRGMADDAKKGRAFDMPYLQWLAEYEEQTFFDDYEYDYGITGLAHQQLEEGYILGWKDGWASLVLEELTRLST